PDRGADAPVVREGDGPEVLEVAQGAVAVGARRVDRFDVRRGQDVLDELRDGEVPRRLAQRLERRAYGVHRFAAGDDLVVRQREVRGARRGDLGAAVERVRDGAQHRDEVDGGGT